MPARYKNLLLAVLVIVFGFGMSELMKFLAAAFNLNLTLSFIFTLVLGLVIIYTVGKKLNLGQEESLALPVNPQQKEINHPEEEDK